MASNCGWALEYIDGLDLLEVQDLSDYWAIEPPNNWILKALAGYKETGTMQDERLFQQTVKQSRPFEQLPSHIQQLILKESGLSEPEFHRQRQAKRKAELLNATNTRTVRNS